MLSPEPWSGLGLANRGSGCADGVLRAKLGSVVSQDPHLHFHFSLSGDLSTNSEPIQPGGRASDKRVFGYLHVHSRLQVGTRADEGSSPQPGRGSAALAPKDGMFRADTVRAPHSGRRERRAWENHLQSSDCFPSCKRSILGNLVIPLQK